MKLSGGQVQFTCVSEVWGYGSGNARRFSPILMDTACYKPSWSSYMAHSPHPWFCGIDGSPHSSASSSYQQTLMALNYYSHRPASSFCATASSTNPWQKVISVTILLRKCRALSMQMLNPLVSTLPGLVLVGKAGVKGWSTQMSHTTR